MSNRRRRSEFTKAVKVRRFEHCNGYCEICGCKLRPGQFDYDHEFPQVEGGSSDFENCRVICKTCHKAKTAGQAPMIAKGRRRHEKHIGADAKPKGWNNTYKGRPVKQKIGGGLVYRDTEEPVR